MLYDVIGRKTPKYKNECETKEKIPPLVALYDMEADCFPVSKRTENKPGFPHEVGERVNSYLQWCFLFSNCLITLEWEYGRV